MQAEGGQLLASKYFKPLSPGEGFLFDYQISRLDRNALFALNRTFDPAKIALARTKNHRAVLNVDDLRKDLFEYTREKTYRKHTDIYYAILESVDKDIFGDVTIVPLTHGAVVNHQNLPKSKSPGIPLKTMGYKTKGEALADPEIVNGIRKKWYAIERNEPVQLADVACYARAQVCSRDTNKIRATWGYPLEVYLTEGQYFYPMLDYLKNKPQPTIAYGVEIGTGGMHYIESMTSFHKGKNFIIGDWSKFDKTIPAWLVRDAFSIVARHIDFSQVRDVEGKLWPVRESKSKSRWRTLVKYFIDTPIQLSTGERFIKHGGVPSGSCWTNVIDGIINAIVMRYLVYDMTGEMPLDDIYLGDDSLVVTTKPIDLEALSELAHDQFSMIFNDKKSYQTSKAENVHFLGYFNLHGHPYKPVDNAIVSSVYPERPTRTKFETIVRLVGQAYSCFDPDDAKRFFLAARLLQDEESYITDEMIKDFSRDNSHFFKYLQTIGVDTRGGLTIPKVNRRDVVFITQPLSPRRLWKPKNHDISAYALLAYEKYTKQEQEFYSKEDSDIQCYYKN